MRDKPTGGPPVLTLHHGESSASWAEHPTEIARQAILAAADVENDDWAAVMRRFASALPDRRPLRRPTPDRFER